MRTIRTTSPLAVTTAAIILADLVGIVVASATDLSGLRHTLLSGTPVSAPVPFMVVQTAVTACAIRWRGRAAGAAAAALVVLLNLVSVASGFGDGSFGKSGLSAGDVAIQAAIVIPTLVAAGLAARQVGAAARRRAVAVG